MSFIEVEGISLFVLFVKREVSTRIPNEQIRAHGPCLTLNETCDLTILNRKREIFVT